MAFKRALWKSGLTYQQTCKTCRLTIRYMDDKLDFRPWFPDGFVYCPKCQTPLRHNEQLAIDAPSEQFSDELMPKKAAPAGQAVFCPKCGNRFADNACFCAGCGAKRP